MMLLELGAPSTFKPCCLVCRTLALVWPGFSSSLCCILVLVVMHHGRANGECIKDWDVFVTVVHIANMIRIVHTHPAAKSMHALQHTESVWMVDRHVSAAVPTHARMLACKSALIR